MCNYTLNPCRGLILGRKVSLTHGMLVIDVTQLVGIVTHPITTAPSIPFLRHDDPKKFGLDGARNMYIKFDSNVDNCPIDIGVWHALPKSLVKKHRFQLNNGTKDELNRLFEDELRNSEYPIFLYLHGILLTRAAEYRIAAYNLLQNLDAHVITFDYRGFGDSTNLTPSKIGFVEDSLIIYSWIRSIVGNERPVFIWGHSVGSGIAQRAFSKLKIFSHTLLGLKVPLPPPQGIVVEGGFNSNVDLSRDYIVAKIFDWWPFAARMIRHTMMGSDFRLIPENYAKALRQYPMLILHSRDDSIIPYRFGKTSFIIHSSIIYSFFHHSFILPSSFINHFFLLFIHHSSVQLPRNMDFIKQSIGEKLQ
ncbi:hypothetical protein ABMA28_010491 [Loxostege sticticalis]|uniref:AB hydrolase-1 domain-containing protein n=1 Tax=Loxostege sticticalis TaxID=481309 RepID=A0ABD0S8E5_LOXSC